MKKSKQYLFLQGFLLLFVAVQTLPNAFGKSLYCYSFDIIKNHNMTHRAHCDFPLSDSIVVYVFLSERCPICQDQTLVLRNLHQEFRGKNIQFLGIFPNLNSSDKVSLSEFRAKYKLDFKMRLDENHSYMQLFQATVTPQVFVYNHSSKQVLYEGKIDNSFERLGRKREVITQQYLRNALLQIADNQCVEVEKTEPVGCFIMP
jgi:peroxiredoxin